MANFEIVQHNFVGSFNPSHCNVEKFRPWIKFLNEDTIVSSNFSLNPRLKTQVLNLICSTAIVSPNFKKFSFTVNGTQYSVDESILNECLNLPTDNFVELPTEPQLSQFFRDIGFRGELNLNKLSKSDLVPEWDLFFDTLSKVFGNCNKKSFHWLPNSLQCIGFAVAHNWRINIGKLLVPLISNRLKSGLSDLAQGKPTLCYYPRFLMIIFERLVPLEIQNIYLNSAYEMSPTTSKKFYTRLSTSHKYLNTQPSITPYMAQFINLPNLNVLPPLNVQPPVI